MGCMGIFRLSSETFDERCRLGAESFRFDLQLFAGEKTEDPTAKRQSDARAEGNIPRSQELSSTFVLLAGFWSLKVFGGYIYNEITVYFTYIYNHLNTTVDTETVMCLFLGIIILLGKTAFPILLIIMIFGLSVSLYQVGINFTTKPLELKFSWLNPINGFGRIFSKKSLVELLKSILKIIIIGYFIFSYLKDQILQMPKLLYLDINASLPLISDIILTLAFKVIGVIFVLSVFDYAYQKWDHFQSLKMSKDEVKEEFKQQEGDPQIKGKIKQKQRQMAMARMMQEVPKADVIVTNPTHFAVALKYQKGMKAPEVIAKGQDYVAQRIKDVAREAGVAIVEDKPLARALYAAVEIGEMVPPELYKSVAEVLAYVYRLKHKNYAA